VLHTELAFSILLLFNLRYCVAALILLRIYVNDEFNNTDNYIRLMSER